MAIAADYEGAFTQPSRRNSIREAALVTISGSRFAPSRDREHDTHAIGSGAADELDGRWLSQLLGKTDKKETRPWRVQI